MRFSAQPPAQAENPGADRLVTDFISHPNRPVRRLGAAGAASPRKL